LIFCGVAPSCSHHMYALHPALIPAIFAFRSSYPIWSGCVVWLLRFDYRAQRASSMPSAARWSQRPDEVVLAGVVAMAHQPRPLMATTATTCLHRARSVQQPHPSVLVHALRRALPPKCRAGCAAVGWHQAGGPASTRQLLGARSAPGTRARPPAASRPRALPQRAARRTSCRPAPRYRTATATTPTATTITTITSPGLIEVALAWLGYRRAHGCFSWLLIKEYKPESSIAHNDDVACRREDSTHTRVVGGGRHQLSAGASTPRLCVHCPASWHCYTQGLWVSV
jgi:hypothetical protein